ncbi:MAG: metallophosphoesterase [Bacteroidales bacterium]|nr:metallophosphoesterase [Bacteroidales bacterium]
MLLRIVFLLAILILIDFYAYRGMRKLFSHRHLDFFRKFVLKTYWLVDIGFLVFAVAWAWYVRGNGLEDYVKYRQFYVIMGAFMLLFIPKASFFLFVVLYDLKILALRLSQRIFTSYPKINIPLGRLRYSLIVPLLGLIFAAYMFSVTLYGLSFGRYNFEVEEVEVWFDDLPESFDGYRLVQFSDAHLGSFSREEAVAAGLGVIAGLQPDLVVFTGDMVNNEAREAEKFIPVFQQLKTIDGMFSVLGNHDMGDYRRWGTIDEKDSNIGRLVEVQTEMGFRMLLNEHVFVVRGNDSIMIAGIENWGLPPFAQYGDLEKALGENASFPFKILLSHDPSHWREQVIPDTDVNLTLSGHTHGMQFGISNRLINWSPVQYKYTEWSGLYHEGNQKLYVNRGFGYLSFPGRVGMPPEITLIVLRKSEVGSPKPEV